MHVTSYNTADWIFFQAKLAGGEHEGEHALFFVDKDMSGVRLVREPRVLAHVPRTHALVAFDDVRVPASQSRSVPRATGCPSHTNGSATSA